MNQIREYRNPILIGVAGVVVALLVYALGYSNQASKLSSLQSTEASLQAKQTSLQAQLDTLKSKKQQLSANCADLAKIATQIPSVQSPGDLAAEQASFYNQLTALVGASGTSIPTFSWTANGNGSSSSAGSSASTTPGTSTTSSSVVPVPVAMTITGSYQQMSAFVSGLDSFPRLFVIQSFNLSIGSTTPGSPNNGNGVSTGTQSVVSEQQPPLWIGGFPTAGTAGPYQLALEGAIFYTSATNALNACQKAIAATH